MQTIRTVGPIKNIYIHIHTSLSVHSVMVAACDLYVNSTGSVTTLNSHFGHLLGEEFIYPFVHSPHEAVLLTVLADEGRGPDLQTKRVKQCHGAAQPASVTRFRYCGQGYGDETGPPEPQPRVQV